MAFHLSRANPPEDDMEKIIVAKNPAERLYPRKHGLDLDDNDYVSSDRPTKRTRFGEKDLFLPNTANSAVLEAMDTVNEDIGAVFDRLQKLQDHTLRLEDFVRNGGKPMARDMSKVHDIASAAPPAGNQVQRLCKLNQDAHKKLEGQMNEQAFHIDDALDGTSDIGTFKKHPLYGQPGLLEDEDEDEGQDLESYYHGSRGSASGQTSPVSSVEESLPSISANDSGVIDLLQELENNKAAKVDSLDQLNTECFGAPGNLTYTTEDDLDSVFNCRVASVRNGIINLKTVAATSDHEKTRLLHKIECQDKTIAAQEIRIESFQKLLKDMEEVKKENARFVKERDEMRHLLFG
ncbi:MAG: hypothetical protein Q9160_005776 [Pyrenula sp. 1 TL-2023]